MAYSLTSESKSLFPLSLQPSAFSLDWMAPALLMTGNESILWEVTWLNRSSQRFLFR